MPATEPLFTRRFVALWAFSFVTFFSAFQLLPVIPLRILQLGGSKAMAGWFLAVYTYASAFSGPVTGTLADRVGRKRLLVAASILFVFFSLAYGWVTWLPLLLVIGAMHGSVWSGILSSSGAMMSEVIPASRRTAGMAFWGLASVFATAIAPAVGLWVFHYGWKALCLELAMISVLMAIWGGTLHSAVAQPPPMQSFTDAWDWRVIRATLSLSVASFGYGGITSYAAILAGERHIEPRSLYFVVYATTIILIRLATSHLGDRLGPVRLLYPALALIPVAYLLLAVADRRWELILSAMLFGAGFGTAYPAFSAYILDVTDPERRGRTFGSILWAFDTGIGTGSLVIGALAQHAGLSVAFAFAAALSCLSIPLFRLSTRGGISTDHGR